MAKSNSNNVLEYKGYHTKVEFDCVDCVLRGKIEGIDDLVDFECENANDAEKEFHEAVDEYLAFCEEVGKEPDKEYKGSFNVRISPELHKKLTNAASKSGMSLNSAVEAAIKEYIFKANNTEADFYTIKVLLEESLKNVTEYQYNGKKDFASSNVSPFSVIYNQKVAN